MKSSPLLPTGRSIYDPHAEKNDFVSRVRANVSVRKSIYKLHTCTSPDTPPLNTHGSDSIPNTSTPEDFPHPNRQDANIGLVTNEMPLRSAAFKIICADKCF